MTCETCAHYKNMKICVKCKLFYDNKPSYFNVLYKEKV